MVLADNPSGMTLDGTNSWVLRAPGQRGCVVVDPGPDEDRHLDRLAEQGPVELILLTHHHLDHSEGARAFSERTGAPVRALDPQLCLGAEGLGAGEALGAAGLDIRVLATPGHTTTRSASWSTATAACSPATPCWVAARPCSATTTARWGTT